MLAIPLRRLALALVVALAACAPAARPPAAPAPLADVSGRWDIAMDVGSRVSPGELWVFRRDDHYTGTVTMRGTNSLPLRALTVRAGRVAFTVDTPEGPVTFDGTVGGDGSTMQGTVTYHGGRLFPLEARRRPAAPATGATPAP